jgi:hypothetical protein
MAARMSFPDTGSRWRWPLSVNNSWFSKGNDRGLLLGNIDRLFWVTLRQMVARLGWRLDHRKSRDSGLVAPSRIPVVLASALPATRVAQNQ